MMHRIGYWMKAQTQYGVHSPFVFDMYRKVLFARTQGRRKEDDGEGSRRDRRYHEMVYRLQRHYGLATVFYNEDEALLENEEIGRIKVVRRPHSSDIRELRWKAQQQNTKYRVSIDIYDVGLLLDNPKLHRQHFLLK